MLRRRGKVRAGLRRRRRLRASRLAASSTRRRLKEEYNQGYDLGHSDGYRIGFEQGAADFYTPFEGTSIIIPTYNQLGYLKACVESITRYTRQPYELIVIDNGSTDGTREYLQGLSGKVRYKLLEHNKGFAGGVNQGLMMARGRFLLFLNNDTIVTDHWLANLHACLNSNAAHGLVGPVTNYISGDQLIETSYKSLRAMHRFAATNNRSDSARWAATGRLTGLCVLMSRDFFQRLGYLDEGFEIGNCEDDDYGLRARLLGKELMIAKDTFIHHAGSKTTKSVAAFNEIYAKNLEFYKNKWGDTHALLDEVLKLQDGSPITMNDFYPSHVAVRGTGPAVYWIENGTRHPLDQPEGVDAVRLSQVELRNWPVGKRLSAEQFRERHMMAAGSASTDGGPIADGGLVKGPDGCVYQMKRGRLHRIVSEWALKMWQLEHRVIRDEPAADQYPKGLPILAPSIVRAPNI